MEKISLCITTFNRDSMTKASFAQVVDDDRIGEIVIVDDRSKPDIFRRLSKDLPKKVRLIQNASNIGCYRNKARSVELAKNDWVIVFDSDNTIRQDYINKLYEIEWKTDTVYLPSFAKPDFNYRHLVGVYDRSNISRNLMKPHVGAMLNTMNYFVHRESYLKHFNSKIEPQSADSILMNYYFLKSGMKLQVVDGLEYDHLIHAGSHFKQYERTSKNIHKNVMTQLMALK